MARKCTAVSCEKILVHVCCFIWHCCHFRQVLNPCQPGGYWSVAEWMCLLSLSNKPQQGATLTCGLLTLTVRCKCDTVRCNFKEVQEIQAQLLNDSLQKPIDIVAIYSDNFQKRVLQMTFAGGCTDSHSLEYFNTTAQTFLFSLSKHLLTLTFVFPHSIALLITQCTGFSAYIQIFVRYFTLSHEVKAEIKLANWNMTTTFRPSG